MEAEDLHLLNEIKNKYGKIAKDYRQNKRMPIDNDSIKIKELIIRTEDSEFSLVEDEIDVIAIKKMVNKRADNWERKYSQLHRYMDEIKINIEYPKGLTRDELWDYLSEI